MSDPRESSDRVAATLSSLDRVVRLPQVSEAAESYVTAVFDGTQDWAHVLESVRVGYAYLGRGGDINLEKGRQILRSLDAKLDSADIVFKTLFPRTADDDECRALYTKSSSAILEINELAQKVRGHVPNPPRITIIQEVCNTISIFLSAHEDGEVPINTVVPFSDAYKPLEGTDSRVKDTIDRYVSTYNAMMPLYKADQISQVRAEVIRQFEGRRYQMEGVPDPFTKKFNNISFEDILYSTEQSSEALSRTILTYVAGMPKGDVYWESMRLFFLLPPRPQEQGDEKYAPFSWNLLLFQKWVSEKLVFPSFRNLSIANQFEEDEVELAREDADFDTKFSQVMDALNPTIARYYAFFLYDTMARGPKNMTELDKTVSIDNAIRGFRITELAAALQSDHVTPGIFIAARAVHTTLARSMHRILPDWTERFTHRIINKNGWNSFLKLFTEQVHRDLDTEQATTLNMHLDQKLGSQFKEKLHKHSAQFQEVISAIWEDLDEVDYWPNPNVTHMIDFSKESIAEIMGLSSIIFNVGEGKSDAIGLHIYLNESTFGLTGKMEQDGSIVWNFNESLVEDGVILLLQYIVSTAFRDLVKYGGIKDVERSGTYVHRIESSEQVSHDTQKKKRSRNRHRSAPRFKVQSRESAPVGLQVASADIIDAIEQDAKKHHREFSPRHVDPFKRNFTNLEAYREAARAYREANDDDKPGLLEALKSIRSSIRQPSVDKIATMQDLPERFKPRPLTDPITGDQLRDVKPGREGLLMWCATWVKAHVSPKATQDEMNSMSVRYRKWYRQASAQAFDSDIKNWIFGFDMSEAESADAE